MKEMSSSKLPTIRAFGQRPISPNFVSRSSKCSIDGKEGGEAKASAKNSRVSLSDFLNRKLQKVPASTKSVQGKQKPFSSPVIGGGVSRPDEGKNIGNKIGDAALNTGLDVAFEQLKKTSTGKEGFISSPAEEIRSSSTHDIHGSRKRRSPFEDGEEKQSARKILVTLGGNKSVVHDTRKKRFISNEKPKPLFNHYANGSGWWDNNMEGVDSDEVGCHEMWEGVGSTTLGGLEWH